MGNTQEPLSPGLLSLDDARDVARITQDRLAAAGWWQLADGRWREPGGAASLTLPAALDRLLTQREPVAVPAAPTQGRRAAFQPFALPLRPSRVPDDAIAAAVLAAYVEAETPGMPATPYTRDVVAMLLEGDTSISGRGADVARAVLGALRG